MEYEFLGTTGLRVSKLGLGTMGFGGDCDEKTSDSIFSHAVAEGINLIDTADVYQQGQTEEILGRIMGSRRQEILICSKAYFRTGTHVNAAGLSRVHLVKSVEASLRRLQTDWLDIFYVHHFDAHTALEDVAFSLDHLVRSGKVRTLGVSNFAAWQIMKLIGIQRNKSFATIDCIQPMYNVVKRQAEVEIFDLAQSEKLGIVTYSPLAGGLLTGKYETQLSAQQSTPPRRFDTNERYAKRYGEQRVKEVASQFLLLCRQRGLDPVATAVRWAMNHAAVSSVLLGARTLTQLNSQLAALKLNGDKSRYGTPAELFQEISSLSGPIPSATDRNEESLADQSGNSLR